MNVITWLSVLILFTKILDTHTHIVEIKENGDTSWSSLMWFKGSCICFHEWVWVFFKVGGVAGVLVLAMTPKYFLPLLLVYVLGPNVASLSFCNRIGDPAAEWCLLKSHFTEDGKLLAACPCYLNTPVSANGMEKLAFLTGNLIAGWDGYTRVSIQLLYSNITLFKDFTKQHIALGLLGGRKVRTGRLTSPEFDSLFVQEAAESDLKRLFGIEISPIIGNTRNFVGEGLTVSLIGSGDKIIAEIVTTAVPDRDGGPHNDPIYSYELKSIDSFLFPGGGPPLQGFLVLTTISEEADISLNRVLGTVFLGEIRDWETRMSIPFKHKKLTAQSFPRKGAPANIKPRLDENLKGLDLKVIEFGI